MKFATQNLLPIAAALLAIFFSGYGVGFLLGEKRRGHDTPAPLFTIPEDHETHAWKEKTLENLARSLELNRRQKQLIAEEIQQTSIALAKARLHITENTQRERLELINRILPHLNATQREQLEKGGKELKEQIHSRFPAK